MTDPFGNSLEKSGQLPPLLHKMLLLGTVIHTTGKELTPSVMPKRLASVMTCPSASSRTSAGTMFQQQKHFAGTIPRSLQMMEIMLQQRILSGSLTASTQCCLQPLTSPGFERWGKKYAQWTRRHLQTVQESSFVIWTVRFEFDFFSGFAVKLESEPLN